MAAKYVLGIDLGTTNSVLAYAPLDTEQPRIEPLPVPQLVAPGTIESRTTLPSFLYLAPSHETESGTLDLRWAEGRDFAVGEMARRQAAELPERTVGAAKSWLCHHRVDRHQPILPWQAPEEVEKISPITASQRYLEHLVAAWEEAFPDAPVAEQQIVLTVPASFDASARELTREAALAAGLPQDLLLLEEPQAAVYSWLAGSGERWRKAVRPGDTMLVCDLGGGTTDLTLLNVTDHEGELSLERMAVGNHLLVGGDNMDLALAHRVAGLLAEQGTQLDPWQSVSLWHACRAAKERLLSPEGLSSHTVSVLGRGSRLIGGTVSVDVQRELVDEILLDGFFPRCDIDDPPQRPRASGFQQIGLPFESDTAITRHLAAFLRAHGQENTPVRPTHLLFNGGVFKADALGDRLLDVLAGWFDGRRPEILSSDADLDQAVARGAAHYGFAKQTGGIRIRGGTARAYYIGIETAGLAIPGVPRPLQALCVAPFGMEEGTECDVPSDNIGLIVGQPAQFRFFSSAVRKHDHPGQLLSQWNEAELTETDSLETELPADDTTQDDHVPVAFHPKLTELGQLELWCHATTGPGRWKLEFSAREE